MSDTPLRVRAFYSLFLNFDLLTEFRETKFTKCKLNAYDTFTVRYNGERIDSGEKLKNLLKQNIMPKCFSNEREMNDYELKSVDNGVEIHIKVKDKKAENDKNRILYCTCNRNNVLEFCYKDIKHREMKEIREFFLWHGL